MSTTTQSSPSEQPGAFAASPADAAMENVPSGCLECDPMRKRPIILLVEDDAGTAEADSTSGTIPHRPGGPNRRRDA